MGRQPVIKGPLEHGRVVGDVVDPFTPCTALRVSYHGKLVYNGSDLRSSIVVSPPNVQIGGDDLRTFYTLIMVDPDAPSPSNPHLREYLHWMVTDIPGSTGTSFGIEVIPYESPKPIMGIHRLVLLIFRQLGRKTVYPPEWRHFFTTREFAQLYNLGSPANAVYFNCQKDNGTGGRRSIDY